MKSLLIPFFGFIILLFNVPERLFSKVENFDEQLCRVYFATDAFWYATTKLLVATWIERE